MMKEARTKQKRMSITLSIFVVLLITLFASYFILLNKGFEFIEQQIEKFQGIRSEALENIKDVNKKNFNIRSEGAIYDHKGNEIARLKERDYEYLPFEKISDDIIHAIISIEDERYFEHHGIDLKGITRAFVLLVLNRGEITQGGSTITQQLVKNIFLTQEKTFDRKFEEIFISMELEKQFTKEQILEFYVNNIYFGHGNYGVETASQYFFSKPSHELTVPEVAFLLAIPNNPSLYDPFTNRENTEKRKNRILYKMHELGYLTDAEYDEYKNAKVELRVNEKDDSYRETYVTSYVIADATEKLMELNGFEFQYDFKNNQEREKYEEKYNQEFNYWNKKIRRGGYHIYTSIDMEKQNIVQNAIDTHLSKYTKMNPESGIYETQGAGVVVENNTGYVVAISGGRTQEGMNQWFNRAYSSYRQPGSTAKPIVSYAPAFDKGMLPYDTMVDQKKKGFPNNVDHRYRGSVTLRYAVEISINTVPFQIALDYGADNLLEYLKEMEFSNIVDEDNHAGVSIGGFTYGVTPLEMAGAYSTFARNGLYIRPTSIVRIEDSFGDVIYEDNREFKRVYSEQAAFLMTDVLKGVVEKPHGTGYRYRLNNMTSAVKTGTTNDNKDGWFIGYTPYYTGVVWVGNDIPKSLSSLYGSKQPGQIWNEFMNKIHKGLEKRDFHKPEGLYRVYINKYGDISLEQKRGYQPEWTTKDIYEGLVRSEEEREERIREQQNYYKEWEKTQQKAQEEFEKQFQQLNPSDNMNEINETDENPVTTTPEVNEEISSYEPEVPVSDGFVTDSTNE